MAQDVRPRWRARWRAAVFHVMATTAATVTLGVLGALAVVAVLVLGAADGSAVLTADALTDGDASARVGVTPNAVQLLAVVPVMVITGTWLGLIGGTLSAPWGRASPPDWSRPVIAGLMGAFHLAGVLERARADGGPVGAADVALSVAVALALWTAIAIATVLGGQRGAAVGRPAGSGPAGTSGRAWREAVGGGVLYALTVTYLAVGA